VRVLPRASVTLRSTVTRRPGDDGEAGVAGVVGVAGGGGGAGVD